MTTVRLEPLDFSQAADNFDAISDNILARLSSIHAELRKYERMAGTDPGGEGFATQYDAAAAGILTAIDRFATQATNYDRALATSGLIHQAAEVAASANTIAPAAFAVRPERVETCPAPPPSAFGGDPSAELPEPWSMVKDFIGMMFPDANTTLLRSAATTWDRIGDDLDAIANEIMRADDPLAGTRSSEVDAIRLATADFARAVRELRDVSEAVSDGCTGYAQDVDDAYAEVFQMLGQLAIEIAASIGIGIALSFFTFGAAGAAAGGVIAARIVSVAARIVQLIIRVGGTAGRVAARIGAIQVRLTAAIARLGPGAQAWIRVGTDVTAGTAASLIAESTRGADADYLAAFAGGLVGGGATAGVLAGFGRRADTLLANVLAGGIGGAAGSAASTGIYGKLDPTSLVLGAVMGTAGGGLGALGRPNHTGAPSAPHGDAGSSAGPDGGAVHVPDGAAPDATTIDLGPDGPTVPASGDGAGGSGTPDTTHGAPDSSGSGSDAVKPHPGLYHVDPAGPTSTAPDGGTPHIPTDLAPDPTTVDLGPDGPTVGTGGDSSSVPDATHSAPDSSGSSDVKPHPGLYHVDPAGPGSSADSPRAEDASTGGRPDDAGVTPDGDAVGGDSTPTDATQADTTPTVTTPAGSSTDVGDPTIPAAGGNGPGNEVAVREFMQPREIFDVVNDGYGAAVFGGDQLPHYLKAEPTLGVPGSGRSFFLMPAGDALRITDAASAARMTGMSPSTMTAYTSGKDVYAILFPTEGMPLGRPTPVDAGLNTPNGVWPHFLDEPNAVGPWGHTAVRGDGFYLRNPTRELVTPHGWSIGPGSVLVRIDSAGWQVLRRYA